MDRRRFLSLQGQFAARTLLSPTTPSGLLKAVWNMAAPLTEKARFSLDNAWVIAGIFNYTKTTHEGLKIVLKATDVSCPHQYVEGLNQAVQDSVWFSFLDKRPGLFWHDLLQDEDLINKAFDIHKSHYMREFQFQNIEQMKAAFKWMGEHPQFGQKSLDSLYGITQDKIVKLLSKQGNLLKGYDWVKFSRTYVEEFEVIHQLLSRFGNHLSLQTQSEMKLAYSKLCAIDNGERLRSQFLKKAMLVLKWLSDQPPPKWIIVPKVREWSDGHLSYVVTANAEGKIEGEKIIQGFITEILERYGTDGISYSELKYNTQEHRSFIVITIGDALEDDFDELCGQSLLHTHQGFLREITFAAQQEMASTYGITSNINRGENLLLGQEIRLDKS